MRGAVRQHAAITTEIKTIEKHIHACHRSCEESRRLEEIPGVGPIVASALVAEVSDWTAFSSGRSLAAWIWVGPPAAFDWGKERLGRISKQGNRHLRWLTGCRCHGGHPLCTPTRHEAAPAVRLMGRRAVKVAAVALANKIARMAWAMMVRDERFNEPKLLPAG
jgi:transposase